MSKEKEPHVLAELHDRKFQVFPLAGTVGSEVLYRTMLWDGEEVGAFLDFAEKAGVDTVYLYQRKLAASDFEDPDEELRGHDGEVGIVELSFIKNNLIHQFTWEADWADGLFEEATSEGEGAGEDSEADSSFRRILAPTTPRFSADVTEALGRALNSRLSELTAAYLTHVEQRTAPPPDPDREWSIREDLLEFLASHLDLPDLRPKENSGLFLPGGGTLPDANVEGTLNELVKSITKELRKRERSIVEKLVVQCLAWAEARALLAGSFTNDRVREFAEETGAKLSYSGLQDLKNRTRALLKERRGSRSHR
ncbi:MAG: hypothetical protein KGJ23_12665 [Euryarchaeota archaeon]|nr:hypothetical protein [Euryarchaeota archaeon]MDE1837451.1 hypothetical protein [Euryarchaeota archaeon]MDE1881876.1 hypothetical protein [Euryarchaeota archaeon]MDE2045583.1 hypothetical protein [Thermoplasmata archaeon]